jgi:hypothetical protein
MAFSFAELLKRQFPLAGVEAYTGSPKRMPESSPFPSESASGALSMGGLVDALGGVSMADYFNNDNWETRQVEGVSKRGEMVDRQYRMNPGDKTTIKVGNDGKIVETTERTTGDLFSEQPNKSDYPVQVSLPSQRGSEFDPRMSGDLFPQQPVIDPIQSFEGGRMPTNTVYPRPTTRSMYNRPAPLNEPDVYSTNPSYQGGMGGQGYIASGRMPTNTVYPRPTTRSMYNRPVNSPDFMGGQGSVNNTGYSGTYGVPMYGQPRPTLAQTSPIINSLLAPELGDTAQSEMNRLPMLINQGEDGVFPPTGPNAYGLDEGMFNEDPDDERRRLLGELLRQYYQTNGRTYTSGI